MHSIRSVSKPGFCPYNNCGWEGHKAVYSRHLHEIHHDADSDQVDKTIPCPSCDRFVVSHLLLAHHYAGEHDANFAINEITLPPNETLKQWLDNLKVVHCADFVARRGAKRKQSYTTQTFYCSRSGPVIESEPTDVTTILPSKSIRSGKTCTAFARVITTPTETKIAYSIQHTGHTLDSAWLRLTMEKRLTLARLFRDDRDFDYIIEVIRNDPQSSGRLKFLNKRLSPKREAACANGSNRPVFRLSPSYGSECRRVPLASAVIYDNVGRSRPVCHFFCFQESEADLIPFFTQIQNCLGTGVNPRILMSDDSRAFINAFYSVFGQGSDTKHLLCTWHVLRSWNKKLSRTVKDRTVQNEVNHYLSELTKTNQEDEVLTRIHQMLAFLDGSGTQECGEFAQYFRDNYMTQERFSNASTELPLPLEIFTTKVAHKLLRVACKHVQAVHTHYGARLPPTETPNPLAIHAVHLSPPIYQPVLIPSQVDTTRTRTRRSLENLKGVIDETLSHLGNMNMNEMNQILEAAQNFTNSAAATMNNPNAPDSAANEPDPMELSPVATQSVSGPSLNPREVPHSGRPPNAPQQRTYLHRV
ncbi:hypothetical protein QR680_012726 [Steinernema hermaphroditum]|uniref:MULE transposase domain-containing protein n=1 Tax=Steinernema hermaphroditum TaxID=289476 RepID=A0AA39M100_9BILA|nr:hypothetical protein QR680_012726 [Steinernema hermaphroditum]